MRIEKLGVNNLNILTELFDYNDVEDMISECTQNIQNGIIDIFVLYDNSELIGELLSLITHLTLPTKRIV